MRKILVVLAMVAASVFLAQPAVADGEAEPDTATVTTESSPPAAEEAPAPAEEPPAPVVEEPAPAEEPPAPVAEEPSAPAAEEPAADESAKQAPAALLAAPADTTGDESSAPEEVVADAAAVKVWICKYVGTPGVDERLKEGKQPINTNSNSLPGMPVNPQVGDVFVDAHGRSVVVQVGGSDPGNGSCEAGILNTEVTTEAPIVSPATCQEQGALSLPNTPGVLYTVDPNYTGDPGTYDVTASALDGYVLSGDSVTAWNDLVVAAKKVDGCITDENPKKVWVCKYVGKPGVDEVLKGGKNPIEVNENSLPGSPVNVQVGDEFSDAQERSVVVALSPADPEPTVEDCGPPIVPLGLVHAEPPTADPATCDADGSLNVPVTDHVVYLVEPDTTGPGDYVITADEADETVQLVGQTVFNITVDERLPESDCVEAKEDELLPDTGGVPLWLMLLAGPMTAAGLLILMRRQPVSYTTSSGGKPAYSLFLPPAQRPINIKRSKATEHNGIMKAVSKVVAKIGLFFRGGGRR